MNDIVVITVDENSAQTAADFATASEAASVEAQLAKPIETITPTDVPEGTGVRSWNAVEPGPYPYCGGIVIPENCFAIIKRDDAGEFSFTKTDIELGSYAKTVELNRVKQTNDRQFIIDNSFIFNSREESSQTILLRNTIEPISFTSNQSDPYWSKFGFWSFMTAIKDHYADTVKLPLYSLVPLVSNLRFKLFINSRLECDITVDNSDLIDTTIPYSYQQIELGKRISIKKEDVVTIGWEMSSSELLQLCHKNGAVDVTTDFGLNQFYFEIGDGSVVSATVPPVVPSSDTMYLPVSFFAKVVYDDSQNKTNKLLEKAGETDPVFSYKIISANQRGIWSYGSYQESTNQTAWYKAVSPKIINTVHPIVIRGISNDDGTGTLGTFFTDSVIVNVAINDKWVATKEITLAELIANGANDTKKGLVIANACRFEVPIPLTELAIDDIILITWYTKNQVDTMSFAFTNIHEEDWTTFYSTNSLGIIDTTSIPPSPIVNSDFQMLADVSYADYIQTKINNASAKTTESVVYPDKIYTVCNDIIADAQAFESRNYSACLYVDHFLKLSSKKDIVFKSTGNDKFPIFSPISLDGSIYNDGVPVKTVTVTDKLIGEAINDIDISISHISTKVSLSTNQFPKVLVIGDSVTAGFLSYTPKPLVIDNPTAYWSWSKKFFELDKLDNAGVGHKSLFIGKLISREFKVNDNTVRSFSEGRGGWSAVNFLYDSVYGDYTNYFYDGAKPTANKFSLAKYLANYKTLSDDGETRLTVGSTAGTLVTNVNDYDVCTPTHVVIQLGFNDYEGVAIANIRLMVDTIKFEYPGIIVIISSIDASGTYFSEKYPMFNSESIDMLNDQLHSKMFNLCNAFKAMEDVDNKIFYCPSYFVQPTAWGVPFRNVDFPENLIDNKFQFKTEHGSGAEYHPNNYAHAAWGYQLYSLIKYTLTL
jgi:hypothetical protein